MKSIVLIIFVAALLAAGCQSDPETKADVHLSSVVYVTELQYAAMSPEARAKGNFVVDDFHAQAVRPYGSKPEETARVNVWSDPPARDKPTPVSADDLNQARAAQANGN